MATIPFEQIDVRRWRCRGSAPGVDVYSSYVDLAYPHLLGPTALVTARLLERLVDTAVTMADLAAGAGVGTRRLKASLTRLAREGIITQHEVSSQEGIIAGFGPDAAQAPGDRCGVTVVRIRSHWPLVSPGRLQRLAPAQRLAIADLDAEARNSQVSHTRPPRSL